MLEGLETDFPGSSSCNMLIFWAICLFLLFFMYSTVFYWIGDVSFMYWVCELTVILYSVELIQCIECFI